MTRLSLSIDLERCIGCKSCEAACKQTHGLGPGQYRNRVLWFTGKSAPALNFLPLMCQQCERPACVRACPVVPKALSKDPVTGVVKVDESRCTGCGECVLACPYGAMGFDPVEHHAVKCDLCADRRTRDLGPACAEVCPAEAIRFGAHDDHVAHATDTGRTVRAHDPFVMGPATVYLERTNGRGMLDPADEVLVSAADTPGLRHGHVPQDAAVRPYGTTPDERIPDRTEPAGCNICFNCCSIKIHFKGNVPIRISGNDEDPILKGKICPKSQMSLQSFSDPNRLMTPLKRIGERGEGRFEPISWSQALEEITDKLRAVRDAHGPEALAIFAGARTGAITTGGYVRLFSQLWGTPNVAGTEAFCGNGKDLAFRLVQGIGGSPNSYTPQDIGSAELYVYMGDNQAETRPVYFGMVNGWRMANGARMVVVDPRYTVAASKADEWLAIRAGTDMAFCLAMIHTIFAEELHDKTFCTNWVVGWEEWREHVEANGYTPEWAEGITSIPADAIRSLAREIASADGCMLFGSRGINHHSNATQTNRIIMFLMAITGNWGRRGGGYANMTFGIAVEADAPEARRKRSTKPRLRQSPTGWSEAILNARPYPIRAMIASSNPLSNWPGQEKAREVMKALDLIVHVDLFRNTTSDYADYVLPVAAGIERGGISRYNDDRRIVWIDKMIEPPGEAKADGWIWIELGKRFGFDDVLKEEYKDIARFWDEVCTDSDSLRGCTTRRLKSRPYRWVRAPVASEEAEEIETLFLEGATAPGAPAGFRFATPSGKLEFFTADQDEAMRAFGMSCLPVFYSEREQLIDLPYAEVLDKDEGGGDASRFCDSSKCSAEMRLVEVDANHPGAALRREGYDTELITGRPPAPHFHSWTHNFWQAQEMWPDLYAQIHPDKAEQLGIGDGTKVLIETAHGSAEARAWLTRNIRETAVFVPIGWDERQPFHPWQPANFLTDKTQRDPLADQTNLKSLLCRVRPAP